MGESICSFMAILTGKQYDCENLNVTPRTLQPLVDSDYPRAPRLLPFASGERKISEH